MKKNVLFFEKIVLPLSNHGWGVFLVALALILHLGGCGGKDVSPMDPQDDYETATRREKRAMEQGKFLGEDALVFGGDGRASKREAATIGVNSYLWRATLDTLSFLPLASADPFGGVILTDWYQGTVDKKSTPFERLRVNVRILDPRLQAKSLGVSVFKQRLVKGQWIDTPVPDMMTHSLCDAILTRARQIRMESEG